jgi:hypothetical protein
MGVERGVWAEALGDDFLGYKTPATALWRNQKRQSKKEQQKRFHCFSVCFNARVKKSGGE